MTGTDPRDELIGSYLRARARVDPPPELLAEISRAVAAAPRQQRRSLFSMFVPAFAGVAVAAALVALAALIGGRPDIGPSPRPRLTGSPAASPTVLPSPSPTDAPAGDALLDAGQTVTMPARDASGEWGRIILRRGGDTGGYEEPLSDGQQFETDSESFYVEVFVEYRADRLPQPEEFGVADWHLLADDGTRLDETVSVPSLPALGRYPGAVDVLTTPAEGWLVFVVPRALEDATLQLVYEPASASAPERTVVVREPGDAPEPDSPVETPPAISYVERAGLPITVSESADADELFSQADTCTNPVAGYTVDYPDTWYTNTEIGDVPACSWFSPVFYEVTDPETPPDEVVIVFTHMTGVEAVGVPSEAVFAEDVALPANDADRAEYVGVGGGFIPIGSFLYQYLLVLEGDLVEGGDANAEVLIASTDWLPADDLDAYVLNRAVLDRIMASIEFASE